MPMDRQQIFSNIAKIVSDQMNIQEDTISESSRLDMLGVDSLDRVEIIMKLEEELNVQIDDQKASDIQTIKDVVDYVNEIINKK